MAARPGERCRGPLARFLGADHDRLDALFAAADAGGAGVRPEPFAELRAELLRHVAMEEKGLIPAATAARGSALPLVVPLRVDHAAIAALLVPSPSPDVLARLRALLSRHNRHEEQPGGLYDECDRALGAEAALRLVAELQAFPAVRLQRHKDGPRVRARLEAALERSRRAWEEWDARAGG